MNKQKIKADIQAAYVKIQQLIQSNQLSTVVPYNSTNAVEIWGKFNHFWSEYSQASNDLRTVLKEYGKESSDDSLKIQIDAINQMHMMQVKVTLRLYFNLARKKFLPKTERWKERIDALPLTEAQKDEIFSDYKDLITLCPVSIPIVINGSENNQPSYQFFDLVPFLLNCVKKPGETLEQTEEIIQDDIRWNALIEAFLNTVTTERIFTNHYRTEIKQISSFRFPNQAECNKFEALLEKYREPIQENNDTPSLSKP